MICEEARQGSILGDTKKFEVLSPKKPNHKNMKGNSATSQIVGRAITFMQPSKIDSELEIELQLMTMSTCQLCY